MSTHKTPIVRIDKIEPHPNADALDIAYALSWPVVVRKNRYQVGDLVVYIPIDSILPSALESSLFPIGSKIKLTRSRVRAIKIRGLVSQGMLIDPTDIGDYITPEDLEEGMDVAELLEITKYEPPASSVPRCMQISQPKKKKKDLLAFKKYTDIEHLKYYPNAFIADREELVKYKDEAGCPMEELVKLGGESVIISQKLHGTSGRAGWFKTEAHTFWRKILKFFGLLPEWTFAWGSRNVQIQAKPGKKHEGCKVDLQGVDFGDVYTKMVEQYDLKNRIPKGTAIYFEIVGDGIQKNYKYGCEAGQHRMYVYDVMKDGRWLDYLPMGGKAGDSFLESVMMMGLPMVPIVYAGPYSLTKAQELATVNSLSEEVNKGVVVRAANEVEPGQGRRVYKLINSEYYLKDNSDLH